MPYDPLIHEGLLRINGEDIIITDAKAADLTSLPENMQEALVTGTVNSMMSILSFDGSSLLIPVGDTSVNLDGMKKGLALLGRDANVEINKAIDEIRKTQGLEPLTAQERERVWV
jgi:hypothetical protein